MTARFTLVLALLTASLAAPAMAEESKEESCAYEAQVMSAVQQARLDNVARDKVAGHIAASSPAWPERYNAAIPGLVDYVYQLKRRDLRQNDFGAIWNQQCVDMWDQRQEMIKNLKN